MSLLVPFDQYTWPMKNPDHKPYQHQKDTTIFVLRNKRAFVLNDLGTGKTLSALWACDFLLANKKIRKVLITSPLSTIQSVWGNEIFYNFPHLKYAIAHGRRDDRLVAIKSNVQFVIINHDGLVTMQEELIREKFDIVIADELTAFKNHKADRSKAAQAIFDTIPAAWGMTAEPTPNGPIEAYGQAKAINKNNTNLPRLFSKFRDLVETKLTPHLSIPKDGAEQVVHQVLQPAIRFVRDKCIDIPPCQYLDIEIPMSDAQTAAYKSMHKELIIEYQEGLITAANAAVKIMKLLQIAAGWVKMDDGTVMEIDSKPRLEHIYDMFVNTHKSKLLVFSAFRASVEGVTQFLKGKQIKAEFIHGDVSQTQRAKLIDQFQNGNLEALVIQPQSTAHGVTLTAASTIAWHSLIPSGEIYRQANGRVTRIGQVEKQTIGHLIGCAAERRVRSILLNKGKMSDGTLELFKDQRI